MMPDRRCPLCTNPVEAAHAPFCSRGCRDRDLLAWLSDDYRPPRPALAPEMLDSDRLDSTRDPD